MDRSKLLGKNLAIFARDLIIIYVENIIGGNYNGESYYNIKRRLQQASGRA